MTFFMDIKISGPFPVASFRSAATDLAEFTSEFNDFMAQVADFVANRDVARKETLGEYLHRKNKDIGDGAD